MLARTRRRYPHDLIRNGHYLERDEDEIKALVAGRMPPASTLVVHRIGHVEVTAGQDGIGALPAVARLPSIQRKLQEAIEIIRPSRC